MSASALPKASAQRSEARKKDLRENALKLRSGRRILGVLRLARRGGLAQDGSFVLLAGYRLLTTDHWLLTNLSRQAARRLPIPASRVAIRSRRRRVCRPYA